MVSANETAPRTIFKGVVEVVLSALSSSYETPINPVVRWL